ASTPVEQPPVIDPATGLPMPVSKAELQDDDSDGLRTPTPSGAIPTRPSRTLKEVTALTPATSTPMAGEKLTELAREGKDTSGSNIYLGKELAKADVKFGTW